MATPLADEILRNAEHDPNEWVPPRMAAAAIREAVAAAIEQAVAAERERAARIAEDFEPTDPYYRAGCDAIAARIRAGGRNP